jgi:hypothetical protein
MTTAAFSLAGVIRVAENKSDLMEFARGLIAVGVHRGMLSRLLQ